MSERVCGRTCPRCQGRIAVVYDYEDDSETGRSGYWAELVRTSDLTQEIRDEAELDDPEQPNCQCAWGDPALAPERRRFEDSIALDLLESWEPFGVDVWSDA